jgi:hypothetical protein
MNRRGFLKTLGIGVASAAVLSAVPISSALFPAEEFVAPAVLGSYAEYVSFSDFALAKAIDKNVADAAHQLGLFAAQKIDRDIAFTLKV